MTKKKFIKLLMAQWYSRNNANRIAKYCKIYSECYEDVKRWNTIK